MRRIRQFYERYPMLTVRLIFFFCGIPLICVVFLLIHELFGKPAYQYLYAPILAVFAAAYFFILRKAAVFHIRADLPGSGKHRFYSFYSGILPVLGVIFLLSSICAFLGWL